MKSNLALDFIISICEERVHRQGEDSFCYCFSNKAGILGVFDGCGGSGSQRHDCYSGHSEAYVAARLCAGAVYDYFQHVLAERIGEPNQVCIDLEHAIFHRMRRCLSTGDGIGNDSMSQHLPTTTSLALIQQVASDEALVSVFWVGDSRTYILDENGLAQITEDNTTVIDPMETLYKDGVLTEVICAGKPVVLHRRILKLKTPFMVLSATDGVFGYLRSPMEFEGLLLETLLNAQSPIQWEMEIKNILSQVAGDDFTICLASIGFLSFSEMHRSLIKRFTYLNENYLIPIDGIAPDDKANRYDLWNSYKENYMRYLNIKEE